MKAALLIPIMFILAAISVYGNAACYNDQGQPFCSPQDSFCEYRNGAAEASDADGDGWTDSCDAFAQDASEWIDLDADGCGHNADIDDLDAAETSGCDDSGDEGANEEIGDDEPGDDAAGDETPAPVFQASNTGGHHFKAPEFPPEHPSEPPQEQVGQGPAEEPQEQLPQEQPEEPAPEQPQEEEGIGPAVVPVVSEPPREPPFPLAVVLAMTLFAVSIFKTLPPFKEPLKNPTFGQAVKHFLF